jgi:hypothetical protein
MLKIVFIALIALHGLIHLMGALPCSATCATRAS